MSSKKILKLLIVSCFLATSAFAISSCKNSKNGDSQSSIQSGEQTSIPGEDSSSSTQQPLEATYTLSFEGLSNEESILVTKGEVIGILPTASAKDGFVNNGWKIGEEVITASTVWNYSEDKTAEPIYVTGTATYTIEHWLEDFETGEFIKAVSMTETKQGTVDTLVAAVVPNSLVGYEKVLDYPDSQEIGRVEADGSLVLKVYYNLNRYTLTLITHTIPEWEPITVKHGETLDSLELPVLGQLTATGWIPMGETEEFDFDKPIESDLKLEAQYSGTVIINTKEDFLNIGLDYPENFQDDIQYELGTDLTFDTTDFSLMPGGIELSNKEAYLVKSLNSNFDAKGHTITMSYNKNLETRGGAIGFPAVFHEIRGTLKNLKLNANTITTYEGCSLARNNYGIVENCYFIVSNVHVDLNPTYGWPGVMSSRTGVITWNFGTVRNCVFNISNIDGGQVMYSSYAVRYSALGSSISNCTMIGNTTAQYISLDNGAWWEFWQNLEWGNSDQYRSDCYVFASIADLKLGANGGMYNKNGTITAGTYTGVIDFYTGSYWAAWLNE